MSFLGIGEIIGSNLIGRVVDNYGSKFAVLLNIASIWL
jgi:hypothetical protein